jgi:hypothetical protein
MVAVSAITTAAIPGTAPTPAMITIMVSTAIIAVAAVVAGVTVVINASRQERCQG